jgi:hypothetical protein
MFCGIFFAMITWLGPHNLLRHNLEDPLLSRVKNFIPVPSRRIPNSGNNIIRLSTSRIEWIVSIRNWPNIEERLGNTGQNLSLELNAVSVSITVRCYIQHRVHQLAQQKRYTTKTQDAVFNYLSSNANDTFLWVALVCQRLDASFLNERRTRILIDGFEFEEYHIEIGVS